MTLNFKTDLNIFKSTQLTELKNAYILICTIWGEGGCGKYGFFSNIKTFFFLVFVYSFTKSKFYDILLGTLCP